MTATKTIATLLTVAALAAMPGVATAAPTGPAKTTSPTSASVISGSALVQLAGDPLSVSSHTRPTRGKKIDFGSAAVKAERALLSATRNDFRKWLNANAPAARITGEFDIALNGVAVELNGTQLALLRSAPMVRAVESDAVYSLLAHDDPHLSLVNAFQAWVTAGGEENAGAGVKVAVIDTGIDVTHPCFDDTGYPAQRQIGDPELTNNKVIVARPISNRIKPDALDANDVIGHGTNIAGTVACNAHAPAVVDGIDIPYDPSGVAPRALLGNYNIVPRGDPGDPTGLSSEIVDALEQAYEDGMDIANLSLGGSRDWGTILLAKAVDNLDRANMVVSAGAGNDGPGYFSVIYPGAAARALTAGASTVGQRLGHVVGVAGTDYNAVLGDFGKPTSDVAGALKVVADPNSGFPHGLSTGCDAGPALPDLSGSIALLGRGMCVFTEKIANAQGAGAIGVIMVQNSADAPFAMGYSGLEPRPTIPGLMVSIADGAAIADHDGATATLRSGVVYQPDPGASNLIASFSSWGPTEQNLLIKPDVVAPGLNVITSSPANHCAAPPCWEFFGGTSAAAPHLAGAAAVIRGLHPEWNAATVRSAIVNTAQEGVVRDAITGTTIDDAMIVGAGLLDAGAAAQAVAALDPVSHSFGAIASHSATTRQATITVTNLDSRARTYTAAIDDPPDDVAFAASDGAFTLASGDSKALMVSVTSTRNMADGHYQATLTLTSDGTEVAHARLFTLVGEGDAAPGQHTIRPPMG